MTARTFTPLLVASSLFWLGCADPPPPRAPEPLPTTGTTAPATPARKAPTRNVQLSNEIVAACKIDFGNIAEAPKFEYDRSAILDEDRGLLEQVATCLRTGALKGRGLKLVGRTDPRGDAEYNMALGQRRAGSARQYLLNLGVDSSAVTETSRGEMDATGTAAPGWELDRRVDILLR